VHRRLLFALPQCSWVQGSDQSQTHGFGYQIDIKPMGSEFSWSSSGDSEDHSSTQGRRGSKLDASWMCSGSSSQQTGADNGRVGA
jgi:hypothetical protein